MKMKKMIALILAFTMMLPSNAKAEQIATSDCALNNPVYNAERKNMTWDTVYFGNYYSNFSYNVEPIKWRVLSVDEDNNALLLADKILFYDGYYSTELWENSKIRAYLNGYTENKDNFFDEAFTETEQQYILDTYVVNRKSYDDNIVAGGEDTVDKIFLLSDEEVNNEAYGFESYSSKYTVGTEYANYNRLTRVYSSTNTPMLGNDCWWLRSAGKEVQHQIVTGGGDIFEEPKFFVNVGSPDHHIIADESQVGIRPALRINLSECTLWTHADISDGKKPVSMGDCIYFGRYKQSSYAEKNPIKWRVLSVENNQAMLLADENLDVKVYNGNDTADDKTYNSLTTWDMCELRTWLNNEFISAAFSTEEQNAIIAKNITTPNATVTDKIYLLSKDQATNSKYGMDAETMVPGLPGPEPTTIPSRTSYNNDYIRYTCSAHTNYNSRLGGDTCGYWWLLDNAVVDVDGTIYDISTGNIWDTCKVREDRVGVRPVINIDLSSPLWEKGESVTTHIFTYNVKDEKNDTAMNKESVDSTSDYTSTRGNETVLNSTENKTIKLSSVKAKKNSKKITGKLSVAKSTVKIKIGKKKWKKADVKRKKFTFKTIRLKKNTKIQIKVIKKGYKTLLKTYKVK